MITLALQAAGAAIGKRDCVFSAHSPSGTCGENCACIEDAANAISAFLWAVRDAAEGGAVTVGQTNPVTISSTLEFGALAEAVDAACREITR